MPTYLRYLSVSLASALVAVYAALWLAAPAPLEQPVTVPPLVITEEGNALQVWGSWKTVAGYDHGVDTSTEIRCQRETGRCSEAYATLLRHDAGLDLEAQVFDYVVTEWDEARLEAIAEDAMAECLDRTLSVDLVSRSAALEWRPGDDDCKGDTGKAVLVGDPT